MDIEKAESKIDWRDASEILRGVVDYLYEVGAPLWAQEKISTSELIKTYRLDNLYFLSLNATRVGVVFLQEADPIFWPEMIGGDCLYIHKLAIDSRFIGRGYGRQALQAISNEADNRSLN